MCACPRVRGMAAVVGGQGGLGLKLLAVVVKLLLGARCINHIGTRERWRLGTVAHLLALLCHLVA